MTQEVDAFELTQSVRAEFDSVNDLELIDHMTAENTLWLLFSDGEHKGDHRLIVAGLDDNRNIVQSTYQWEIGAPSGFGKYSFLTANPAGIEIVIFAPSSPQAIVFKPNDPFDWFGSLDGPYFFEVGLGATTGGNLGISVDNNQAIVTLHPDKQELKVFVSPPY
ncbi:putative lipoprotein [Hyphomonas hirschiana VP5]|nr:putative lipoprotein [Hyphomonas hirschiana VP5]